MPRQLYFHIQLQADRYYLSICLKNGYREMELELGFRKIKDNSRKNNASGS